MIIYFFSQSILAQDQYVLHGAVLIDVVKLMSVTTTSSLQRGQVTTLFCRCFFIGSTLVTWLNGFKSLRS